MIHSSTTQAPGLIDANQAKVFRSVITDQDTILAEHTYESAIYEHKLGKLQVAIGMSATEFFAVHLSTNLESTSFRGTNPVIFSILMSDIGDIDVIRDSGLMPTLQMGCMTVIIRKKNPHYKKYTIHCQQYSQMWKRLKTSWSAWHVRASSNLPELSFDQHSDGTLDYYHETINCLKDTDDFMEKKEILDELSEECLTDLNLKDIAFKSREIFLNIYQICNDLLKKTLTEKESIQLSDEGLNKVSDNSLFAKQNLSYQSKLHGIVLQRLLLFRSATKLFIHLIMNSESLESRTGIFAGPFPLTIDTYIRLYTTNVYERIKVLLECIKPQADDIDETDNVRNSIKVMFAGGTHMSYEKMPQLIETPRELFFNDDDDDDDQVNDIKALAPITPISSHRESRRASALLSTIPDDVLTPLRSRIELQKSFSEGSSFTLQLKQSTCDLQMVALYEVAKIIQITSHKNHHGGIHSVPLGEVLVKTPDWEDLLEKYLQRISDILDNFIQSQTVIRQLTNLLEKKANRKGGKKLATSSDEAQNLMHNLSNVDKDPLMLPASPSRKKTQKTVNWKEVLPMPQQAITPNLRNDLPQHHDVKNIGAQTPQAMKEKSAKFGFKLCSFETQEILIFYATSLLLSLARDIGTVRESLKDEYSSYFAAILNVLNTICPHPSERVLNCFFDDLENETYSPHSNSPTSQLTSNILPILSSSSRSVLHRKHSSKSSHHLTSLFYSMRSKIGQGSLPCVQKYDEEKANQSREWHSFQMDAITSDHLPRERMQVDVATYGEPRYEMNENGWTLLVIARRNIETLLEQLELKLPIKASLIDEDARLMAVDAILDTGLSPRIDMMLTPKSARKKMQNDEDGASLAIDMNQLSSGENDASGDLVTTTPVQSPKTKSHKLRLEIV